MKPLKESLLDLSPEAENEREDEIISNFLLDIYKIVNPLNHVYLGSVKTAQDRFGHKLEFGDVILYTTEKTDELKRYGVHFNHTSYYGIVTNTSPLHIALTMNDRAYERKLRDGGKYHYSDLQSIEVTPKEIEKIVKICSAAEAKSYFKK